MKMRHTLAAAATVAVAALALTGCTGGSAGASDGSGSASGKVTGSITFQTWSLKNATFTPYFESLIKAFEKKYPGTTVDWVDQPANGYEDKLLQQAESNQLPDVVNLPPNYAYTLASTGQIENLAKTDASALSSYVPGGLSQYRFDGLSGTYSLPWYLGTNLSYWNMDLLKKGGIDTPPTTLAEFYTDAAALAKQKIYTISGVPDAETLWSYDPQSDPTTNFFHDGKFVFATKARAAQLQEYVKLNQEGAVSPDALSGSGASNTNANTYVAGQVAWTTGGPNYVQDNLAVNAPTLVSKTDVTPVFGQPPLYAQGISVSNHSKNEATAIAFANYVTNNENQVAFVKLASGFFPGTKKGAANPSSFAQTSRYDVQNKAVKVASGEMAAAGASLSLPQYTTAMSTYSTQQDALALEGKISAMQALQNTENYCNQNLSK